MSTAPSRTSEDKKKLVTDFLFISIIAKSCSQDSREIPLYREILLYPRFGISGIKLGRNTYLLACRRFHLTVDQCYRCVLLIDELTNLPPNSYCTLAESKEKRCRALTQRRVGTRRR